MSISAKNIAKTALLPGIFPRLRDLSVNSFGMLAFLMAMLYRSVNLLPPGHPFTLPANHGRFGIKDVIGEAANNLVLSRSNIDQIIIFFTILIGLAVLIAQAALLVFYFLFDTAWAQGYALTGLFNTANPEKDMAFSMLDGVFAVPGVFGSEFDPAITGVLSPFHEAMHNMFAFYSYAMLMIGAFIVAYYILVAIFETAQSGVPFGQRFDSVWAPLRLVVALFLLVPVGYGLNSAQYITLYAAKYGSGFATNGWLTFWNSIVNNTASKSVSSDFRTPLGFQGPDNERVVFMRGDSSLNMSTLSYTVSSDAERYRRAMLAVPKTPSASDLTAFKGVVETCKQAYRKIYGETVEAYFIRSGEINSAGLVSSLGYSAYGDRYKAALQFYDGQDIRIRYGRWDPDRYPEEDGGVKPICGEITFTVVDPSVLQSNYINSFGSPSGSNDISPATKFQEGVFELVVFEDLSGGLLTGGQVGLADYLTDRSLTDTLTSRDPEEKCKRFNGSSTGGTNFTQPLGASLKINQNVSCDQRPDPDGVLLNQLAKFDKHRMALAMKRAFILALEKQDVSISQDVLERGWGGAALWYNKIAALNGQFVAAVNTLPRVSHLPSIMEEVTDHKPQSEEYAGLENRFEPFMADMDGNLTAIFENPEIEYNPRKQQIAEVLSESYQLYNESLDTSTEPRRQVNFLISMINSLLGMGGIYDIRDNFSVHPLAQLTSLGRSLVDASMRNLAIASLFSVVGGFSEMAGAKNAGQGLQSISAAFGAFFTVSLTAGVVLYYIVPFMPFLFFFFAMITWVKSIFEAMVGLPLWALAHLRIQGNGLPGQAAASGYFIILEIFLRPILIVFGLLAGSIIFFTEVYLLHIIYDLVVSNLAGSDPNCSQLVDTPASELPTGCLSENGNVLPKGGIGFSDTMDTLRAPLDQFFFTILYVIIVYMMATSTFKLIDSIPKGILRWLGSSTEVFADNSGDPTENLTRNTSIATNVIGRQIGDGLPGMFSGAGKGAGKVAGQDYANMMVGSGR